MPFMRVLVVEDDANLAASLAESLRSEGMLVDIASDGVAALDALRNTEPDVVLLDRDLPRLSGDGVCREMRAAGHPARVLMLTAAGSLRDRVDGLDLGADDYLGKPFAYVELLARMRALARRGVADTAPVLEVGTLRLDTARRLAENNGARVRLSPKEFDVLEALMRADGGYLSRINLLDTAWDDPDQLSAGILKVTIHSLRRKLGETSLITYSAGFGYRLENGALI